MTHPFKAAFASTVLVLALAASGPARAADPVFPAGARVGLIPPDGVKVANEFVGFESDDKSVKIGIAEIPEEAFAKVEEAFKEGKPTGTAVRPEAVKTAAGDGFMTSETHKDGGATIRTYSLIARGEKDNKFTGYVMAQVKDAPGAPSDEAIRKMLASVTLRKDVPVAEQLDLLPFKVAELADFKTIRTLPSRSGLLITDGGDDTTLDGAPYMVIGLIPGRPETPEDKSRFAQQAATQIPGLRNARITMNEPQRIDGTPGFETRIEAVTGKNDTPVLVVQWIRFGSQTAIRMIGSATKDAWPKAFPRFRAVRDGIGPK